jgi:hypothetical protein
MKWQWPEQFRLSWRTFLFVVMALLGGLFLETWMGYENCASPRCWGDPISFGQALERAPRIILVVLLSIAVVIVIAGIRTDDS